MRPLVKISSLSPSAGLARYPLSDVSYSVSDPFIEKQFGSVRLLRKLGEGAMGMVYQGYHEAFEKDVAVKLLKPVGNEAKEQFHQRFLREGRAAARVHHENVVQVMDAGHEHGHAYLVLEFVKGASLGDILTKKGRIDASTVMHLGRQIASGIAAIHGEEIIHRDIKPDNILLGAGGIVKITDLGLAKELDHESVNRLTMSGMVVGTPYYISPEAITDATNAKAPADVYSFGATMYHLLAGRPPFDGGSAYEVMRSHLENRLQPLREIDRNINPNLANLIERCLDKNPNKRPHAKDIANIIDRGGRVQSSGRGIGYLAVLVIALIVSLAIITWTFVQNTKGNVDLVAGENAAEIEIVSNLSELEIKIDRTRWQSQQGPVKLANGKHTVLLRRHADGVLMFWQGHIDVTPDTKHIQAQLNPVPVKAALVPIQNYTSGLVYFNGRCLGHESTVRIEQAGQYNVCVWQSDQEWQHQQIHLDINGTVKTKILESTNLVPQQAFLREFVNNEPVQSHHVLSWFHCEQIRKKARLLEPSAWADQALAGHNYAQNISPALAVAIEDWAKINRLRLLNQEEAIRFKTAYGASVWYSQGRMRRALGNPNSALMIVVPE